MNTFATFRARLQGWGVRRSSVLLYGALAALAGPFIVLAAQQAGVLGAIPGRFVPDNIFTVFIAPFSVWLLYEIIVLAIAIRTTIAVFTRIQFEVVSLLIIRESMKKLDEAGAGNVTWNNLSEPLLLIGGGLVLYFIIELIERAQVRFDRNSQAESERIRDKKRWISIATLAGVILCAGYATVLWITGERSSWLDGQFVTEAFSLLIAANILQLIVTAAYTHAYESLFEYSLLILTIVMTMIVLPQPAQLKIPVIILLAIFALITLYLHGYARGSKTS